MRGQKVLKDRCGGIIITQALVEQELSFISAVYRQNVLQKEMFVAELAGVPIGIISRFESTKEFFLDYLTDQLPMTIVSVSDEEMMMEDDEISERTEQMVINSKIASALADYNAFLMRTAVISVDGQGVGFASTPRDTSPAIDEQGDRRWYKINQIVRDEIDNSLRMIEILERAKDPVFDHAASDAEQTIMRLGPKASVIRDLRRRISIMEAHRRDFLRLYRSYNK